MPGVKSVINVSGTSSLMCPALTLAGREWPALKSLVSELLMEYWSVGVQE